MMRKFRIGSTLVDPTANEIQLDGNAIRLEPKTIELLHLLASRAGQTVSKEELFETLRPGIVVTEDSIVRCVSQLRKAFGDPELIETIVKRGYRVNREVEFVGGPTTPHVSPEFRSIHRRGRASHWLVPTVTGLAAALIMYGNPYFPYVPVNAGLVLLAVLVGIFIRPAFVRTQPAA